MFMKIAMDRESIIAIRPIHNARAALGYRPGRASNQYAYEGKEILLPLPAERGPHQKIPRKQRTATAESND
jgi:hypothetical protein